MEREWHGREPGRRSHRPIEDRTERRRDHRATKLRRHRQHLVDHAQHLTHALQVPPAVRLGARHLIDHLVHVHAHHRISVNQLLKLGNHGMEHHVFPPSLHPFPVTREPGLEVVLAFRQPAGPTPHVNRI